MAQQVNRTTAVNPYNVAVTQQSGKVGNVRYIQRNGLTYVRSASNSVVNNARSDKQMEQRMKFASLSALYSLFGTHLHTAFQGKKRNQSDFNAFMQANQGEGAYMSKDEKASGKVIPLPAIIAQGSLSGTCTELSGSDIKTDLLVAANADITTVAKLSARIIASNSDWKYGDQLTVLQLIQGRDNRITAKFDRIILSATDTSAPLASIKVTGTCIAISSTPGLLGAAIIHTNAGKKSSKSAIVLTTAGKTIYDEYTSDEQYEIARATYGTSESRYLRAGSESSGSVTPSTEKATISVDVSPEGAGTVAGAGRYAIGSTATLTANPGSGYVFQKWSDGVTTATRSVTVEGDKEYFAMFMLDD